MFKRSFLLLLFLSFSFFPLQSSEQGNRENRGAVQRAKDYLKNCYAKHQLISDLSIGCVGGMILTHVAVRLYNPEAYRLAAPLFFPFIFFPFAIVRAVFWWITRLPRIPPPPQNSGGNSIRGVGESLQQTMATNQQTIEMLEDDLLQQTLDASRQDYVAHNPVENLTPTDTRTIIEPSAKIITKEIPISDINFNNIPPQMIFYSSVGTVKINLQSSENSATIKCPENFMDRIGLSQKNSSFSVNKQKLKTEILRVESAEKRFVTNNCFIHFNFKKMDTKKICLNLHGTAKYIFQEPIEIENFELNTFGTTHVTINKLKCAKATVNIGTEAKLIFADSSITELHIPKPHLEQCERSMCKIEHIMH
jgi:hypothetical protein